MSEIEEEEPLDPTLERVRRKMIRLLFVSIGIMTIGLMAVLGAIVYRIGSSDPSDTATDRQTSLAGTPEEYAIDLPEDSEILDTHLDNERILIRIRTGSGQALIVFGLPEGKVLARVAIQ